MDWVPLVVFRIDATRFGVPLSATVRAAGMVALSAVPGAPEVVLGAIDVAGQVVPVVDLRRRLRLAPREFGVAAHLLLVATPRRMLAVPADEVLGVSEVEAARITDAGTVLPGLGRVKGVAAQPDGLLFLYDLEAFLDEDEERQLAKALEDLR